MPATGKKFDLKSSIMGTNREHVKGKGPPARRNETKRADALDLRLRDVAMILAHTSTPASMRADAEVRRVLTLLTAEIAILRHPSDPEQAYWARFCGLLAELFPDDPDLWDKHALPPIAAFQAKLAGARQTFERDHEAKHHHHRLVEDAHITAALGLTRTRVAEVFGEAGCSIRQLVRERKPRFDPEVSAELRGIADREGISSERVIKAFMDGGRPAVQELVEATRAKPKIWKAVQKRGRPKKRDSLDAKIASAAKQLRLSARTIESRLKKHRAAAALDPKFDPLRDGWESADDYHLANIVEREPRLGRRRKLYPERELIERCYLSEEGKPLSDALRWQWMSRNLWHDKVQAAKTWASLQKIPATSGVISDIVSQPTVLNRVRIDDSARPLRESEVDYFAETSTPAGAETASDGR